MTAPTPWRGAGAAPAYPGTTAPPQPANLADLLERVLDKGIVIAGDIRINLLDIELLTIRIRLLIASVDRAREMGIDWWEHDSWLSSGRDLALENRRLRERLGALEAARSEDAAAGDGDEPGSAGVDGDAEAEASERRARPSRARRRGTS
ncbi:gas vesicle protein [Streptomyces sp. TLI_171]|uniref:gas vesicle protein n=1 Tax=Streptomyces sp. TLI_171 TaxID=1938859 RepID=UPI000C183CBA|nr:gas vesicle protein [Streptomyces sp. TLI_171]RKE17528.1 gas vesicle protein GvpA/GvpJ/GvpM family [Streptomyces sp. TLI_171]